MHIDKTRFKPLMEQEKQHRGTKNLCLYYEKLGHVAHKCPNKHDPHVARTIFVTNPQLEESLVENVSFFTYLCQLKEFLKCHCQLKFQLFQLTTTFFDFF
jgi:hypothetical protein